MAGVPFSILHPDLRLGLLLAVVVLLLNAGASGAFGAETSSGWLDPTPAQYGLLTAAGVLGALFVMAAAIRVDRGPPRGMMAAGALALALGPFLALSDSFPVAVARIFFTGVGGAFVGLLVFYALAVKGYARFKGTLIGSLALVFNMRWGTGSVAAWGIGLPLGWWAVAMVVAGGALLFLLLPRWFTGHYGVGSTLRETLAVPGAKLNVAWVAAVYLVASLMVTCGGDPPRVGDFQAGAGWRQSGVRLPVHCLGRRHRRPALGHGRRLLSRTLVADRAGGPILAGGGIPVAARW